MSPAAKWEYMKIVYQRYHQAEGRKAKGLILDEFCKTYGCHRKHALRLLNAPPPTATKRPRGKRGSPYSQGRLPAIIEEVWRACDHLCGQRLKPALLEWLPDIRKRFKTTQQEEALLGSIASATLDRMLKAKKLSLKRRIYGTTKPGTLLKHNIPIKTDFWDVDRPGYTEVDLVSHSGPWSEGDHGYTLDMTDVMSGWVERRCVLGKAEVRVQQAIDEIRRELPFDLLGIDSDNGSEFINDHLYRYCKGGLDRSPIQFTRSRPYKKDDNAHVEQKNWTHVRKLLGYGRYDKEAVIDAINDLYRNELRWFQNLLQPSMRLQKKVRVGSKVRRRYDSAKTPLRRLLESGQGDPAKLQRLKELREVLNPFELSGIIERKLKMICAAATNLGPVSKRARRWQMETYSSRSSARLWWRSGYSLEIGKFKRQNGKDKAAYQS